MLRLRTRAKYEIASISERKGAIRSGAPVGKKMFISSQPLLAVPIKLAPRK
jgi:hypothetical protein